MPNIKHAKVSASGAPADPDLVGGDDWNDDHVISGSRIEFSAHVRMASDAIDYSLREQGSTLTYIDVGHLTASYPSVSDKGHVMINAYPNESSFSSYKTRAVYSNNGTTTTIDLYFADSSENPVNPNYFEVTVVGVQGV